MTYDVIAVIVFIITVIVACKAWNAYSMKKYEREISDKPQLIYGNYIDNIAKLELAGIGNDGNGDYNVTKAIQKIDMPDELRIQINE